ncbi:MAG: hypothetical protein K0S44_3020 [Bacteroidetes bacterium]|jgi:hypothetical protein|nr:hypothetical protein [Bacteroidota bacterium]
MTKVLFFIPVIVFIASCTSEKGAVPIRDVNCDSTISYSADIAPLMNNYCNSCHVSGGTGTGDFTTYAGVKEKADNGSLRNRVVVLKDMPQPGSPQLTEDERIMIDCWIKQGSPDN